MGIDWQLLIRTAVILGTTFLTVYFVRRFFRGLNKRTQKQSLYNKFFQSILTARLPLIGD